MALAEPDGASDRSSDFLEHAFLSYTVPFDTGLKIEEVLRLKDAPNGDVLSSIRERESLFFDETIDVYFILRTPYLNESALRSYCARLNIVLEAQVVNSHTPERGESSPTTEVIYNGTVEDVADPLVILNSEAGNGETPERYVLAAWKLPVFLSRPRIRLQNPSVVFTAAATLKSDGGLLDKQKSNGYLTSGVPSGLNLLESFGTDPALGGIKPYLSALRVSRVAPVTHSKDSSRPVKGLKNITLKIVAAVHTRVRFARPNTVPPSPAIIAMLEVDFTSFFDCEIVLEDVNLSLPEGVVEDLNQTPGLALPLTCVAHDHITFLYRLAPEETDVASKVPTRELDITIKCTALEEPDTCMPRLKMAWATTLDFTLPVNPGFGPATQPIQRSHRPSQLSISDGAAGSLISPSVSRPDALPGLEAAAARTTEATIPDLGITMTFSAPEGPIRPGEEFVWNVFVVNRSKESGRPDAPTPPRKLALLAIPRRRRNEVRVVRPPSTAGHARRKSAAGGKGDQQIADAVLDENVVHAMQRSSIVDSTEVVCLSADARVGPLAPGACHVVELRFIALKEGVVGIECIRVVDLATQEHVDVRDLPVMIVEKGEE